MKELKEIRDDQIRVIGTEEKKNPLYRYALIAIISIAVIAILTFMAVLNNSEEEFHIEAEGPGPCEILKEEDLCVVKHDSNNANINTGGFVNIKETLINDVPLKIYIPHNADLSLHIGKLDRNDPTIVYAAQAADIRADNGGIVGAFVLGGEPRAWGISKKGYCAAINGEITIGAAENSPLFEQATQQDGYFFRQYPLVSNGKAIENEPKGKSIRRGICEKDGRIFMVESIARESFYNFAQALALLGVDNAIYLVGSSAYGWAVDSTGTKHEFGVDDYYTGKSKAPENISYVVWRKR